MAESQGPEPASGLIFELISFATTILIIDQHVADGAFRRWAGRKLRGIVAYLSLGLDALHGARETIREAEAIVVKDGI